MVFCHKNNIEDPFDVQLKDCRSAETMSNSDFWGRPLQDPKKEKLFCHHKFNRCMLDPHHRVVDKLAGDTCINNYECLSGRCEAAPSSQASFCAGLDRGQQCSDDKECSVGLFCGEKKVCEKQKRLSQECSRDFECLNNMACANSKCERYGGIFNGQISDNALACQGAYIDHVEQLDGYRMPESRCFQAPVLEPKQDASLGLNPNQCSSPTDTCFYVSHSPVQQNFTLGCECGLSPHGTSYCPKVYSKKYTEYLFIVLSKFGMKCHTTDRFDFYRCWQR